MPENLEHTSSAVISPAYLLFLAKQLLLPIHKNDSEHLQPVLFIKAPSSGNIFLSRLCLTIQYKIYYPKFWITACASRTCNYRGKSWQTEIEKLV